VKSSDKEVKGRLLQSLANYAHEFNPGEALEIQRAAFDATRDMFCPPTGVVRRLPDATRINSAERVIQWMASFASRNGALASWQATAARLSFESNHETFEAALKELGAVIGAESVRPEDEMGEGPDNLMVWGMSSRPLNARTRLNTLRFRSSMSARCTPPWRGHNRSTACCASRR
jgi:hypothetical protein